MYGLTWIKKSKSIIVSIKAYLVEKVFSHPGSNPKLSEFYWLTYTSSDGILFPHFLQHHSTCNCTTQMTHNSNIFLLICFKALNIFFSSIKKNRNGLGTAAGLHSWRSKFFAELKGSLGHYLLGNHMTVTSLQGCSEGFKTISVTRYPPPCPKI